MPKKAKTTNENKPAKSKRFRGTRLPKKPMGGGSISYGSMPQNSSALHRSGMPPGNVYHTVNITNTPSQLPFQMSTDYVPNVRHLQTPFMDAQQLPIQAPIPPNPTAVQDHADLIASKVQGNLHDVLVGSIRENVNKLGEGISKANDVATTALKNKLYSDIDNVRTGHSSLEALTSKGFQNHDEAIKKVQRQLEDFGKIQQQQHETLKKFEPKEFKPPATVDQGTNTKERFRLRRTFQHVMKPKEEVMADTRKMIGAAQTEANRQSMILAGQAEANRQSMILAGQAEANRQSAIILQDMKQEVKPEVKQEASTSYTNPVFTDTIEGRLPGGIAMRPPPDKTFTNPDISGVKIKVERDDDERGKKKIKDYNESFIFSDEPFKPVVNKPFEGTGIDLSKVTVPKISAPAIKNSRLKKQVDEKNILQEGSKRSSRKK
jgi:hypothetical protein